MILKLEDNNEFNLSASNLVRGIAAVATGGASEAARGIFGKKSAPAHVCACEGEKNLIKILSRRLKNCKEETGWKPVKKRSVNYNPQTGVATFIETPVMPEQLGAASDLVSGALKLAGPYGAAAGAALDVGKKLFGGKTSASSAAGDAASKLAAYASENKQLKTSNDKLTKQVKSLKRQRYYFGGGGMAAGVAVGMLLKR